MPVDRAGNDSVARSERGHLSFRTAATVAAAWAKASRSNADFSDDEESNEVDQEEEAAVKSKACTLS